MKHIYRIFIVLAILLLGSFVLLAYKVMPTADNKGINKLDPNSTSERVAKDVFKEGEVFRILVLGVDKTATKELDEEKNGMRSDTMMLVSIDKSRDKVQMYSIPRDSYIRIHGYDKNKVNAAFNKYVYKDGGLDLTKKSIEDFLDIEIDHYAIVDYKSVEGIVDAVGGMDIEWKYPDYKYTDDWVVPALEIDLKNGINHLDGESAVSYLRARKAYPNQDLDRIDAQQDFIKLMLEKLKSPSIIFKLPELLDIVDKYVETDLNYGEISYLAQYGLGLDLSTIEKGKVPGRSKKDVKIGSDLVEVYLPSIDMARKEVLRTESEEQKYQTETPNITENNVENSSDTSKIVKKPSTVKKASVIKKKRVEKRNENDSEENKEVTKKPIKKQIIKKKNISTKKTIKENNENN